MSKPEQNNRQNGKSNRWNRYSAYLYLAMALLIVGVATASIFALNRSISSIPEYSAPEFSIEQSRTDSESSRVIPLQPDNPVFDEESGIVDESSYPPVINEEPLYVCPVDSEQISKACSLDKLVFSATMNDYRVHTGLDLAAPIGAEVRCYAAGTVESVQDDDFYGKTVTVRHEYGLVTVYSNLAPELASGLETGKTLKAGELIGYVGTTAVSESADEPHLHFEMQLNGSPIDPQHELFG